MVASAAEWRLPGLLPAPVRRQVIDEHRPSVKRGRVVVTGAGGQLGRQLVTAFAAAGWQATGLSHGQLDISDRATLSEEMDGLRPDVVINAAAWTDVDGCARDPERALAVNGSAAGLVAEAAAEVDAVIVQISTNEVFDGQH